MNTYWKLSIVLFAIALLGLLIIDLTWLWALVGFAGVVCSFAGLIVFEESQPKAM